ncbi:tubulin-tyrosine ligase-like protein [Leptomonas pyrrhocoris]|uniref:Tubulin-tyrosine ligase-like protein n=1 Tax=Leptomonas pyrrhocoris TaxID=157538 RepID=A0A0N0VGM2_LEPPY|nr:tubulin-tyrosine ligase-like protein [Leptomonas pyrrhocoris]KPA83284.1 tubulin-tyrosine ligase-like protein [Leptomonas pyrrhocoris]|eukprot:XP_015661723.1 tubulin-tyrosine ligase-like protein [Leptomonas pyrrhocoris]
MLRTNLLFLRTTAVVAAAASHALHSDGAASSSYGAQRTESVPPMPVHLKPSSSPHRKPSFYFPRMRDEQHPTYAFQPTRLGAALPLFNITSSSCEYYALRLPLLKAGFRRVPAGRYDIASNLLWGRSMPFREMMRSTTASTAVTSSCLGFPPVFTQEQAAYRDTLTIVNPYQRFNHYPLSHANLGCKRGMAVNVRNAQQHAEAVATTPGEREEARMRYGFMPRTWFYPQEKESLIATMKAAPPGMHFIWKPARGSCGRGILISDGGERNAASWEGVMRQIEAKAACRESGRLFRSYVVQEYIENPFLVEGRKMDLRLYVAVTSYNPLTVYWHEEGLVRLAAESYTDKAAPTSTHIDIALAETEDGESSEMVLKAAAAAAAAAPSLAARAGAFGKHLHDRFRHLTNYSVGRKYVAAQEAVAAGVSSASSLMSMGDQSRQRLSLTAAAEESAVAMVAPPQLKWPLQRLWDCIDAQEAESAGPTLRRPSDKVRENIAQLITRTLMAARPVIDSAVSRVMMPGHYFELYGFDVMLDAQLNPFLIEVNTLPSLESSSPFDYATKTNVVADLLNIAMIEPFERTVKPGDSLWNSAALRDQLQQPLSPAERTLVNSCTAGTQGDDGSFSKGVAISRDEVQLRLKDELAYARGFQRIFPAKPVPGFSHAAMGEGVFRVAPFTPLSHAEHPLDSLCSRPAYMDDVRFYNKTKVLTPQDLWALESS